MDTGVKVTEEEYEKVLAARSRAENAPVMNFRVGDPTMSENAIKDCLELMQSLAVAHGLPDGSFYYGISAAMEFTVPPGFEDEFGRLTGAK